MAGKKYKVKRATEAQFSAMKLLFTKPMLEENLTISMLLPGHGYWITKNDADGNENWWNPASEMPLTIQNDIVNSLDQANLDGTEFHDEDF